MDILLYAATGAFVGLCIGLTGIGGGSLMTPLLLFFGYPLPAAIGTDLLYAACTKAGGMWAHSRQKRVNWQLVKLLAIGSLPMSVITILLLKYWLEQTEGYIPVLTRALGIMLVLTALVVLLREQLKTLSRGRTRTDRQTSALTIAVGGVLGICVTLSSVGAGAFAAAVLMLLYARLPSVQIVGTDIAHAVPLTLVAGLGHFALGNVDFRLLFGLLLGSLPAVALGSRLAGFIPDIILRTVLASILALLGIRFIFF